jgi:hypothetical protein
VTDPVLQINTESGWRDGEQQMLHLAGGLAESDRVVVVGIEGGDLVECATAQVLRRRRCPRWRAGLAGIGAIHSATNFHAHASKSR